MNSDTNKERPTPETDALAGYDPSWNRMIPADFARRLERQLAEAREKLSSLTQLNAREMLALESSLRKAESQRDRLAAKGTPMSEIEKLMPVGQTQLVRLRLNLEIDGTAHQLKTILADMVKQIQTCEDIGHPLPWQSKGMGCGCSYSATIIEPNR